MFFRSVSPQQQLGDGPGGVQAHELEDLQQVSVFFFDKAVPVLNSRASCRCGATFAASLKKYLFSRTINLLVYSCRYVKVSVEPAEGKTPALDVTWSASFDFSRDSVAFTDAQNQEEVSCFGTFYAVGQKKLSQIEFPITFKRMHKCR